MAKSKAVNGSAKHAAPNVLSTVKNGGVTKPSQTPNAKSKTMAKDIAAKSFDAKKRERHVEPEDDEDDDDEDDDDEEDDDDDDDDDDEDEDDEDSEEEESKVAPVTNGHAKAAAPKVDKDEDDDEDESESDDEPAAAPVKTNGAVNGAKPTDDSSDSSESSEDDEDDSEEDSEDDEEEKSAKPSAAKGVNGKAKPAPAAKKADEDDDDEDDDEDDDDDDDDDDDSEDDSEEEEEETKVEAPSKKRKADQETATPVKKTKTDDSGKSSTLFAGNLSWKVDDQILYDEFQHCSGIVGARVITDKETGRSRGFGYVDFASGEDAEKAYNDKQGAFLEGRDMRLDFSTQRPANNDSPGDRASERARKFGDAVSAESDTLFIGNLSFNVDEETVSGFFSEVCNVKSIRLPTDQETGRFKGFGYVTFYSVDDAKTVFGQLNGESLDGRAVRLDYAAQRPARDNNGGGRGGFGGRGGGFGGRGRGGGGGFGGRGGGGRGGGRGGFGGQNRGGFQGKKITF